MFLSIIFLDKCTLETAFYHFCDQDHLVFMTEISCMDDFVQKILCGERLPAEHDQQLPGFACTKPFTVFFSITRLGV